MTDAPLLPFLTQLAFPQAPVTPVTLVTPVTPIPQARAAGKERWFCNVLSSAVESHLAQHGLNVGGELSCTFTGPLPPYSEVRLRMNDVSLRNISFKTAWHSSDEIVATIPMLQVLWMVVPVLLARAILPIPPSRQSCSMQQEGRPR